MRAANREGFSNAFVKDNDDDNDDDDDGDDDDDEHDDDDHDDDDNVDDDDADDGSHLRHTGSSRRRQ